MTMELTLTKRRRLLQGIYTRRKYLSKKLGVKDGGGGGGASAQRGRIVRTL